MPSHNVCLVGAFPPPVHGVSLVNSRIQSQLYDLGLHPFIVNLSPRSLDRIWYTRLSRIVKVVSGLNTFLNVLLTNRDISLYVGLSGGYGQLYETLFIVVARCFNRPIFLHHHSYAYLTRRSLHTNLLVHMAGSKATHIVLCETMGLKLQNRYKFAQNVVCLSNAAILKFDNCFIPVKSTLQTIAYLGNITPEKGIFEFLSVVLRLASEGIAVQALIAGPFQDSATQRIVLENVSRISTLAYVGPKYGQGKMDFYKKIDVLLFPTKYKHEAEPLTIHEAMSHSIPVIAWERGCIKCILGSDAGLVIEQTDNFVSRAVEQIKLWKASSQSYQAAASTAQDRFLALKSKYSKSFDELLSMMISSSPLK